MSLISSYGATKDRKIYGNCQVFSPGGILMFRCDDKKANWYLNRDLADIIKEKPLTIKLKFQPQGLGNHNKEFGLTEMSNKCVCCGSDEYLTRHHVVPYCYRKYFPISLKSHNFHDVLSLCVQCHEKYERQADKLKDFLATEYNAPVSGETTQDRESIKFSKMAMTLLKEDLTKIPAERIKYLKSELKNKFSIKRLSNKKLNEISEVRTTILNKTHGQIVMSQINDIQSFVEMWRSHFLENNQCQYLPRDWNVKTKINHAERLN